MQIKLSLNKYLRDYLKNMYDRENTLPDNVISISSDSKIAPYIIPYLKNPPADLGEVPHNFLIRLNWKLKFFDERKNYLSHYDQSRFQYTVNYMFLHEFTSYVYRRKVRNFIQLSPETQKDIILSFCEDYHISFDWDADVYDTMKKRLYRFFKYKK